MSQEPETKLYSTAAALEAANAKAVTFRAWRNNNGLFAGIHEPGKHQRFSLAEVAALRAVVVFIAKRFPAQRACDFAMKLLPLFQDMERNSDFLKRYSEHGVFLKYNEHSKKEDIQVLLFGDDKTAGDIMDIEESENEKLQHVNAVSIYNYVKKMLTTDNINTEHTNEDMRDMHSLGILQHLKDFSARIGMHDALRHYTPSNFDAFASRIAGGSLANLGDKDLVRLYTLLANAADRVLVEIEGRGLIDDTFGVPEIPTDYPEGAAPVETILTREVDDEDMARWDDQRLVGGALYGIDPAAFEYLLQSLRDGATAFQDIQKAYAAAKKGAN